MVRSLSRRFWWPGADLEDVEQEAWFALERCRGAYVAGAGRTWRSFAWLCVERHLRELRRRECYRRPQFAELHDVHTAADDVPSRADARARLRTILEHPLPAKERRALDGLLVGEQLDGHRDNTRHQARYRAKKKLLTALA